MIIPDFYVLNFFRSGSVSTQLEMHQPLFLNGSLHIRQKADTYVSEIKVRCDISAAAASQDVFQLFCGIKKGETTTLLFVMVEAVTDI